VDEVTVAFMDDDATCTKEMDALAEEGEKVQAHIPKIERTIRYFFIRVDN
jgi:hypothetical protein